MPDLGRTTTALNSETLTLTRYPDSLLKPPPDGHKTLISDTRPEYPIGAVQETGVVISMGSIEGSGVFEKVLDDYVADWKLRRIGLGIEENRCFLPFLVGAPSSAECRVCTRYIYPGDGISCTVRGCQKMYHMKCRKETIHCSAIKKFKCPQHGCFVCKQKFFWRCVRCDVASHDKCAAWPDDVIHLKEQPGWAVCWRHPQDWRQEQDVFARLPLPYTEEEFKIEPTVKDWPNDIVEKDVFARLPLPYTEEEFRIEPRVKDWPNDIVEPPSYVHIRRNIYLVKRKRDVNCVDVGCTSCSSTSTCSKDCLCRVQSISCSRACRCSEACTNRPFRKDKKIKIVKTDLCGWGVEAAESINKGDFVIEYVGEVVDDVECTQRLWAMKNKDLKNFYMCEIKKNFTIDATFKGNASRFLNHSCDPNCKMEKWQVEGEIRVGVFASCSIEVGEPLTYDYRFVQFGPEVKCHCGGANCQGYLGAKRKINLDTLNSERKLHLASLCWGSKRRRAFTAQNGTLQHIQ